MDAFACLAWRRRSLRRSPCGIAPDDGSKRSPICMDQRRERLRHGRGGLLHDSRNHLRLQWRNARTLPCRLSHPAACARAL